MNVDTTLRMPSNFVDMTSDELAYDGGIDFSTIMRDAAIVCGIVVAAGVAIGFLGGAAGCFASGMTETMFNGVFKTGVGMVVGGSFGGTAALIGWGWAASLEAATKK